VRSLGTGPSLFDEYQGTDYEDRRALGTETAVFGYDELEIERRGRIYGINITCLMYPMDYYSIYFSKANALLLESRLAKDTAHIHLGEGSFPLWALALWTTVGAVLVGAVVYRIRKGGIETQQIARGRGRPRTYSDGNIEEASPEPVRWCRSCPLHASTPRIHRHRFSLPGKNRDTGNRRALGARYGFFGQHESDIERSCSKRTDRTQFHDSRSEPPR